jgi:hypothetical protein
MAYDLLLDSDSRDLVISKGKMGMTSTVRELLRQRINITFRTLVGEWFLNTQFGLYDKDVFLNKQVTKTQVDAYIVDKLNQFPEVLRLKSFEGSFDGFTRTYSCTFVILTEDGNGVFRVNLTPPGVEVSYPDPKNDLEALTCEIPDVDNTNAYYEMMNFDLPTTIAWL